MLLEVKSPWRVVMSSLTCCCAPLFRFVLSEFHASWICSLALSSDSFEMGKMGRGAPSGWVVSLSLTGVGRRRLCGIVWMRGVWSRAPPSMGVVSVHMLWV